MVVVVFSREWWQLLHCVVCLMQTLCTTLAPARGVPLYVDAIQGTGPPRFRIQHWCQTLDRGRRRILIPIQNIRNAGFFFKDKEGCMRLKQILSLHMK